MWFAMTRVNSGGGASVCEVFLTNLDEIGSLDHSCMQITPQSTFGEQTNKIKKNNKKERENRQALV